MFRGEGITKKIAGLVHRDWLEAFTGKINLSISNFWYNNVLGGIDLANKKLYVAKSAKFDEFYTQYDDIQSEVNAYLEYNPDVFRGKVILLPCDDPEWSNFTRFFAQNFDNFGIKKLIRTSYALESKAYKEGYQLTFFEQNSVQYDANKAVKNGKIFTLTRDGNKSGKLDLDDLEWSYLSGDGSFQSAEVKKLRDEADIIITNPPFSLYRNYISWILEKDKKFLVIGNKSSVTYREIFPLIMTNRMWSGKTSWSGGLWFETKHPTDFDKKINGVKMKNIACAWFTNLDHGRRHQPLNLMTRADNVRFSKHKEIRSVGYPKYDNYDAIEVAYTDAIPSDYDGIMGVPISFLEKYNPDQFEILSSTQRGCHEKVPDTRKYDEYWEVRQNGKCTGSSGSKTNENANLLQNDGKKNYFINTEGRVIQSAYQRIFIRFRKDKK